MTSQIASIRPRLHVLNHDFKHNSWVLHAVVHKAMIEYL